jgi:hypothetical protein
MRTKPQLSFVDTSRAKGAALLGTLTALIMGMLVWPASKKRLKNSRRVVLHSCLIGLAFDLYGLR